MTFDPQKVDIERMAREESISVAQAEIDLGIAANGKTIVYESLEDASKAYRIALPWEARHASAEEQWDRFSMAEVKAATTLSEIRLAHKRCRAHSKPQYYAHYKWNSLSLRAIDDAGDIEELFHIRKTVPTVWPKMVATLKIETLFTQKLEEITDPLEALSMWKTFPTKGAMDAMIRSSAIERFCTLCTELSQVRFAWTMIRAPLPQKDRQMVLRKLAEFYPK